MKHIDITLPKRTSEHTIYIDKDKHYNIVVSKELPDIDLSIKKLLVRQLLYGDELYPLITHLTQDKIEILLDLSLLGSPFLFFYDDMSFGEIDSSLIPTLEREGSFDTLALTQSVIDLQNTVDTNVESIEFSLESLMSILLQQYISMETGQLPLDVSLTMTDITYTELQKNNMSLLTQVTNDLYKQVFLEMTKRGLHWLTGVLGDYDDMLLNDIDNYFPSISLIAGASSVYLQYNLMLGEHDIALQSAINDLMNVVMIRSGRNSLPITSNDVAVLNTISLPNDTACDLVLGVGIDSLTLLVYPNSDEFEAILDDTMTDEVKVTIFINTTNALRLGTEATDDIELWRSMEFYDNDLLMTWDDYTLENMENASRIS